jgi:hypothetical protein
MKKIILVAMLAMSCSAFAQTMGQQQGTDSTSVSGAVSNSQGGAGGTSTIGNTSAAVSGVTSTGNTSGNLTVGCLVNCSDTSTAAKEAGAADIQVALINAAVAKEIAAVNAAAAKEIASHAQVIKNTPSVSGPNLVTSNDTCMGSTSGSVNIAGLGLGGGTSWVDGNCKMLKNSRELWNMGMKAASLALMCTDTANKEALELTGFECPQTTKANGGKRKVAEVTPVIEVVPTVVTSAVTFPDPIVRTKLDLTSN